MSWAAHIVRVPPDWNYSSFEPETDEKPDWPKESRTHFQWWQTKTDPSPISPIFATVDEMATYAIENSTWPYFAHFDGLEIADAAQWIRSRWRLA